MAEPREHFILHDTKLVKAFTPISGGGNSDTERLPDHVTHGAYLEKKFQNVWEQDARQKAMFAEIKNRGGTYIEFSGSTKLPLKLSSLENKHAGSKLLNVKIIEGTGTASEKIEKATVFLPDEHKNFFNNEIEAYKQEPESGKKPKNQDNISHITDINLSTVSDFWFGRDPMPGDTAVWCEVWITADFKKENDAVTDFFEHCNLLNIHHSSKYIVFPEKVVTLCKTSGTDLQKLINTTGVIAELHLFHEPASFFVKEGQAGNYDREQWIENLKSRIVSSEKRGRVCIFDTGLNRGHPLLEDVTKPGTIQSVDPNWNASDVAGHGTEMAGVCEYFDLGDALESSKPVQQNIELESVKILSDTGENDPNLYGQISADAVATAQIAVNDRNRVHCMAVTVRDNNEDTGSPTSWSGALDNVISGYEDSRKKLFIVSAGDVALGELDHKNYPQVCYDHSVESPAQAWNALSVGAVNTKVQIRDQKLQHFKPVAESGDLSPFSATSNNYRWGKTWPVKPEVLFEGGNAMTDGVSYDSCDDLSVLTTDHQPLKKYFTTINATSAATAQAAYTAAQIYTEYPNLWPETVRGLIVHSAQWTDKMWNMFPNMTKTDGRHRMLHTYGYGVADFIRARNSFDNAATMIIEDELQPYAKKDESDYVSINEMHLHHLPWPHDFLSNLGETKVKLKVTLSYFIDAAPDNKGWKNKYRYASAGLRFDINNYNEVRPEDFLKRINKAAREEKGDKGDGTSPVGNWTLGPDNRDVGSIHSDYWEGSAAVLADSEYIAVYPVSGWWKDRPNLHHYTDKLRYSLIVSLSTDDERIKIYDAIKTIIDSRIETAAEIKN